MNAQEQTDRLKEAMEFTREKFPDVDWPNPVKEPITIGRFNKRPMEDYFALCDANTGEFFQFISSEYALVMNEEAVMSTYNAVMPLAEKYGQPQFRFQFPGERITGTKSKFLLKVDFPTAKKDVKKGDPVCPQIVVKNSYDKTWKHMYEFGILELVCTNGMTIPKGKKTYAKRHIGDVSTELIETRFHTFLEEFDIVIDQFKAWDSFLLESENYQTIWTNLPFSEKEQEKIEALNIIGYDFSLGEKKEKEPVSVWELSKATSQYLTHEMKSDIRAENINADVSSILDKFVKAE